MERIEDALRLRVLTALLLVGVFAAGVVTGAAVLRWLGPPRPPPRGGPHGLPPPWAEVGLRAEQEQRLRELMERHQPEIESVLRETFPRIRAIHEQIERQMVEVLDAAQRQRLRELKAHAPPSPADEGFRGRLGPPPPGHGPPPHGLGPPPPPDSPPLDPAP